MQSEKPDLTEELAQAIAPYVCRSVYNGDADDVAARQDHARHVVRIAILPIISRHQATAAPVQGELVGLAGLVRSHVEMLANTGMALSLTEWSIVSNDLLRAAAAIEALSRQFEAGNARHD